MRKLKFEYSCGLIKGISSAVLYDSCFGRYKDVSIPVYKFLMEIIGKFENEIFNCINVFENQIVSQLIEENFLIFEDHRIQPVPEFNEIRPDPSFMLLLSSSNNKNVRFNDLNNFIEIIKPELIEFRFDHNWFVEDIYSYISAINIRFVKTFDVVCEFNNRLSSIQLIECLSTNFANFHRIKFYNVQDVLEIIGLNYTGIEVFYSEDGLDGIIDKNIYPQYFICDYNTVLLSKFVNIGQYNKIRVDSNGNLKNIAFENEFSFHITNVGCLNDLYNSSIADYWSITKDQIEVCSDCQYRYFCHDTSEIIQENGVYRRKESCNYNIYNNSWDFDYLV